MIQSTQLSKYIGDLVNNKHVTDLSDTEIEELKKLLFERKAIFFEDQFCSKEQLSEFAKRLKTNFSKPNFEQDIDNSVSYHYGNAWHSDRDYEKDLPTYTVFQINKLPSNKITGATEFLDMVAFYNYGLSKPLTHLLDGCTVLHEHKTEDVKLKQNIDGDVIVYNPIIRTIHPAILETTYNEITVKSVFVNPAHTISLRELYRQESDNILNSIYTRMYYCTEFQYRHHWKEGSLVIWDNRLCQHKGIKDFEPNDVRQSSRIVVY